MFYNKNIRLERGSFVEQTNKNRYFSPKIVEHYPLKFENQISGGDRSTSSFPGKGWGVEGTPPTDTGNFPGGGNTGGVFPGRGHGWGRGNSRP